MKAVMWIAIVLSMISITLSVARLSNLSAAGTGVLNPINNGKCFTC